MDTNAKQDNNKDSKDSTSTIKGNDKTREDIKSPNDTAGASKPDGGTNGDIKSDDGTGLDTKPDDETKGATKPKNRHDETHLNAQIEVGIIGEETSEVSQMAVNCCGLYGIRYRKYSSSTVVNVELGKCWPFKVRDTANNKITHHCKLLLDISTSNGRDVREALKKKDLVLGDLHKGILATSDRALGIACLSNVQEVIWLVHLLAGRLWPSAEILSETENSEISDAYQELNKLTLTHKYSVFSQLPNILSFDIYDQTRGFALCLGPWTPNHFYSEDEQMPRSVKRSTIIDISRKTVRQIALTKDWSYNGIDFANFCLLSLAVIIFMFTCTLCSGGTA